MVLSCQRHGKDPFAYLRDVLTQLPAMTHRDDLTPLLPSNWTPPTGVEEGSHCRLIGELGV